MHLAAYLSTMLALQPTTVVPAAEPPPPTAAAAHDVEDPPLPPPRPAPVAVGPRDGEPDALAAARMTGNELASAGMYFVGVGIATTASSALYLKCGSEGQAQGVTCLPGIGLGLAVGGLINTAIGLPLAMVGVKRMQANDAWLARGNRRSRMITIAANRGLRIGAPVDAEGVARGRKLWLGGLFTLAFAGAFNGIAIGVAPLSRGAGIGLNVMGVAGLGAGIGLSVAGKRKTFRSGTDAAANTRIAPIYARSSEGAMHGIAVVGRF